ncbi:DUF1501 domain-containing protein [Bremerella sp. JC817]|uniref:DUF1501 domain-containing protein n=1 Tax=Bremerella sp. JC817 TaxID=3231756 RepID=UPI0034575A67
MHWLQEQTRRHFFRNCGVGIGKIALASLLAESGMANEVVHADNANPFAPKSTHFPGKAKRVIYLFMAGAPSQLELFDYKPKLAEMEGKPIPPSVIAGQRYAFIQPDAAVLGPRFKFAKHGQCGAEISEMLPGLSKVVDDITILRSVHTDHFNHSPAQLFCNTGNGVPGRPSMGSWLSYGLGSEAHDLPSFVVLKSGGSLSGGAAMWNAGFLPSVHQGVPFRGQGDPILHVSNPPGFDTKAQRESLDLIRQLNQQRFDAVGDPEIRTRMEAYEMAFRMQSRAPELMEFSQETQETMDLYGANPSDPKQAFANNCLLARRLAERGVRFVQVYHAGWDHHSNVEGGIRAQAKETDQACAALVEDLRRRGMLDDTLIVWGGEFGRTPMVESSAALGRSQGRDHHPQAFTMWFSGGGMKPGLTYGKTDEVGFNVVENKVHVHDVQATILHALGIDHTKLTFRHRGLNFKLTGVEEHHPILDLLS